MKNLSDPEKEKDDNWSLLTSENLEVYHTREFEDAKSIVGEEDEFKELNIFGSEEHESFKPIVEGQTFEEFDTEEEPASKEKKSLSEKKETKDSENTVETKLDAVSIIVEEEKKAAYEQGLKEGLENGRKQALEEFEKENKNLREEEKAKGFEEGKTAGYEEGKHEALEEGKKEFETKLENLSLMLDSMNNSWSLVLEKYEEEIVALSLGIAKKILYGNLTLDADFVKLSIKEALKEIPEPVEVTIGVNPDDYNIIEMIKEDFFQRFENLKNITIISDPTIGKGGCRIDSESGGITQTIENRLKYLEDSILKNGIKKGF